MGRRYEWLLLIGFLLVLGPAACAPRPSPQAVPVPPPQAAADPLFGQAEKKYAENADVEALALYEQYLARYPDGPLAAAALMKIGSIRYRQGNYALARQAFSGVISGYPPSPFRSQAMVELLYAYFREGSYQAVVDRGAETLAAARAPEQRFRTFAVIGDAEMALGTPEPAVESYARALTLAGAAEQETIAAKLKTALLRMDSRDVDALAERRAEGLPMDYLLFQAGMVYAQGGRVADALVLLKAFLERYPDHPQAGHAQAVVAELEKQGAAGARAIGCLLPLTGAYQAIGQRALRAIEFAASRQASQTGAPQIHVLIKDTGSDPDRTIQALKELDLENASAVIGPLVHAEAAAHEAQQLGIPIVTITQKSSVVGIGEYVFRNFITPAAQMKALSSYAVGKLGVMRAAVLYPDESYGLTFAELFRSEFEQLGGVLVTAVAYSPKAVDFAPAIQGLLRFGREIPKNKPPGEEEDTSRSRRRKSTEDATELILEFDAVFIPDEPRKVAMLVPQLAYHDVKNIYLLGTNLWHSDALLHDAGAYIQGAVMPDAFFAESPEPSVREFVAAFEGLYQDKPGFMEAVVYDSAMILFQVLSSPGIRFRSDVSAALHSSGGFPGVTGFTRFDSSGDAVKRLHILQVRKGGFIQLE
jgi:ABC-type branched-subunit amino acid transport system substrate-binding protein